ncbi:MAG TPA: tetratricopeptide repeat-containing sensor histidine kinase [Cyclobacteriaceae bacterium]
MVVAQDRKAIDSLALLVNKSEGAEKCEVLYKLAIEYATINDNNTALGYVDEGFSLAEQIDDSLRIVKGGRIKGQILRRLDKINEAIEYFKKVIPTALRNKNQEGYKTEYKLLLNALAITYTYQAKYDEALKVNFQSLQEREIQGDKREISIALNNIGIVYFKLKNYESALKFYDKALALKNEAKDKYDLDRLFINMGLCYNQLNDYSKAHKYFEMGFKECDNNCNDQIKVEGNFGLGVSYYRTNEIIKAQEYFQESYKIAKEIGNKKFQAENLIYQAHIFLRLNKQEDAIRVLTECERIDIDAGYNEILIETYKEFSRLYTEAKDFEKASSYQSKYIHLKDSIYNEALIKNIAKIQTDYEERENKAIIATKEEVIQRQRSLNIAIGIISVLACLLIFVLYQSNKVKKRVNQALSDAKNFIELKNIELDKKVAEKTADLEVANDSLSKVNEELDNFIYKTSHDIRGPLASLKGICNVALMDVKDPVAVSYLEKLDITAENLNTILTRLLIINQINNSSIKPEPINFDFIIEEVMLLEKKRGLPPRLQVRKYIQEGLEFYCDKEFIRIILENLIDNAIKFYNDSDRVEPFVEVRIEEENREMKIRVIDNGIGISEAKPDKIFQMFSRASERSSTGGIGLYITKTACEKIGGQVGLRTTPEGYTEFYVKFVIDTILAPVEFGL